MPKYDAFQIRKLILIISILGNLIKILSISVMSVYVVKDLMTRCR